MFSRNIIGFCVFLLFFFFAITTFANNSAIQPQQIRQMQAVQGAKKVNPVADAPVPIPKPVQSSQTMNHRNKVADEEEEEVQTNRLNTHGNKPNVQIKGNKQELKGATPISIP